jgi:hypothetical protein
MFNIFILQHLKDIARLNQVTRPNLLFQYYGILLKVFKLDEKNK